jgi:hypothetical protein
VVLQAGIEILFETEWHVRSTPLRLLCKLCQICNYTELNNDALLFTGRCAIPISANAFKDSDQNCLPTADYNISVAGRRHSKGNKRPTIRRCTISIVYSENDLSKPLFQD